MLAAARRRAWAPCPAKGRSKQPLFYLAVLFSMQVRLAHATWHGYQ
jgi:hypothetical protein